MFLSELKKNSTDGELPNCSQYLDFFNSEGYEPDVTKCSEGHRKHLSLVISDIIKSNPEKKLSPKTFRGGICIYQEERATKVDEYFCATRTYKRKVPTSDHAQKWGLDDEYEEREFIEHEPCHPAFLGTWSTWTETGQCSVNSGQGHLIRKRRCLYPPCKGATVELNYDLECDNGESLNIESICFHNTGIMFSGELSDTKCIRWTEADHPYFNQLFYPELTDANCRNPLGVRNAPWCFISKTEWQYCDIMPCQRADKQTVIALKTVQSRDIELYNRHLSNSTTRQFPIGCQFPFLYHGVLKYGCTSLLETDLSWISGHGVEKEESIEICSILGRSASVTRETFMVCSSLDGKEYA